MKNRFSLLNLKDTFLENSRFRDYLLTIMFTGLFLGLYRGIMDNYLAEIVGMGEVGKGVVEFFRELPGVLLILILASFYMFSAETLYKAGAFVIMAGLGLHAILPPSKVLIIMAVFIYSTGEHIMIGMRNTLALKYAKPGRGGQALGAQTAIMEIGTLAGFIVVVIAFSLITKNQPFTLFFGIATVLAALSALLSLRISGKSETDETKRRFYFHKKYSKYYMLEMFYGARKQVFLTFGPYVLVLFYGAKAATISLLFAISAVACFFASPLVGRIIDKLGYKLVMIADTLLLVVVCFFYGFAHHLFPMETAFIVCCISYIMDSIISLSSMASNLYVQDLSDSNDEMKSTISMGVSINHLISIFIALCGGFIWRTLGIELLFVASAVLGLCNSAYAATIKTNKKSVQA